MSVYLLHLDPPYKHARHYVGWASSLLRRLRHHADGSGARLLQVVKQTGGGWRVARVWPGADRTFERSVKRSKAVPHLCPICNPKQKRHLARSPRWPSLAKAAQ